MPRLRVSHGLAAAAVFSVAVNMLVLATPLYMLQVYDRVLATRNTDTLLYLTLIALFAIAIYGVMDAVRQEILVGIARWWEENARPKVFAGALRRSRYGGPIPTGIFTDVATTRSFLTGPSVMPLFDAPWVPFFIFVIWMMHPWLGLVAIGSALVLLSLAFLNDISTRKHLRKASLLQTRSDAQASQFVRGSDNVLAMGMTTSLTRLHKQASGEQIQAFGLAARRNARISGLSKSMRIAMQVAVLGVGALLVIRAEISAGAMIASSIILGRALAPLEQFIGAWRQMVNALDARRRLKSLIDETHTDSADHLKLPTPVGALALEDVYYAPKATGHNILENVSFGLEAGAALAIIGPSGSGKSTLCRLIVGAISPSSGQAKLDGAAFDQWNPGQLGETVGFVSQNSELFFGTVAQNIARFAEVEDETVVAAAKLAGCHEMILGLPGGYNSQVGDNGQFLSGGQRQRIALARAVYGEPKLVVLDEANAFLDVDGEFALLRAINELKQKKVTIVMVTHRTALLKPMDKLSVLRGGRLVAFGERDRVLKDLNLVRNQTGDGREAAGPGSQKAL